MEFAHDVEFFTLWHLLEGLVKLCGQRLVLTIEASERCDAIG